MINNMTFGEKLRKARTEKLFTQKKFAEIIGAAHNSISNWENNQSKPDLDTIELICRVLDITPNYLLGGQSFGENTFEPSEVSIIKKYRSLDSHGKEIVNLILEKEFQRIRDAEE